jgi:ribonuclease HI
MAVMHGLTICWESGYRRINCLSDSLQAVNLIRSGVSLHHRFANEVFSIRQLLTRDWEVVLFHTLRERNSCADVLAKMGAVVNAPLVMTSTPPRTLARPLFEDTSGVIFTRE